MAQGAIILFSVLIIFGVTLYYYYVRQCMKVSTKSKILFFNYSRKLLHGGELEAMQVERVHRWISTVENPRFTKHVEAAINAVYKKRYSDAEISNDNIFNEELYRLFDYWLTTHMFSNNPINCFVLSYKFQSMTASEISTEREINKDIFSYESSDMPASSVAYA